MYSKFGQLITSTPINEIKHTSLEKSESNLIVTPKLLCKTPYIKKDFYSKSTISTINPKKVSICTNTTTTTGLTDHLEKHDTPNLAEISSFINEHFKNKTPRSTTKKNEASSVDPPNNVIVEGRGQAIGEIGLACIDFENSELCMYQFSDQTTYVRLLSKINLLKPSEILLPDTMCDLTRKNKLVEVLSRQFNWLIINSIQRKYFNETRGMQYVKHLNPPEFCSVELIVQHKYYSLSAVAALLKFIEMEYNILYEPRSLRIVYCALENLTMIDTESVNRLELLQNSQHSNSSFSLFEVLNHTRTKAGARMLRSNILQPPSDLKTIISRLDCIQELVSKPDLFYSLQEILGRFIDISTLLWPCIHVIKKENTLKLAELHLNYILNIKQVLELVKPLEKILSSTEEPFFLAIRECLRDHRYESILNNIRVVIRADARAQKGNVAMRTQRCFAIKPGINGLLDIARRTYCEVIDDIIKYIKDMATDYNVPLRQAYNASRGFHIQIPIFRSKCSPKLPDIFIQIQQTRSMILCTTEFLIQLDQRSKDALNEVHLMSNVIIIELMSDLRDHIGCLYHLSESVAKLDMLVSLANCSSINDWIRPEFTETTAIKSGIHPILQKVNSDVVVGNDVYLSEGCNMIIISGPNMSGKSTYLKQIALIQIIAQLGSFVPAQYASFKIIDQIFARMGIQDNIECNASSFKVEVSI